MLKALQVTVQLLTLTALCIHGTNVQALGPQLQALEEAAADTDFIWYGYAAARSNDNSTPEAVLFTATDSSWLLFERGGGISTLGPGSQRPRGQKTPRQGNALTDEEFERLLSASTTGEQTSCAAYSTLRASLENLWEARALWFGQIAMAAQLRLELFNAPDGRWALVVHQIEGGNEACLAHHGRSSRWVQVQGSRSQSETEPPASRARPSAP